VSYTAQVFSGSGTWTGGSSALWGDPANWTDTSGNGVHAAPGTFTGFTNTDTATLSGSAALAISLLGANPSLAVLNLSGTNYTLSDGTLTLSSAGTATVTVNGSQSTINSLVNLASNADMVVSGSADVLQIDSPIVGDGSLSLDGAGTLELNAGNNYDGGTYVNSGTLVVGDPNALPGGSSLTVGNASAFGDSLPARSLAAVPEPSMLALLAAGLGCAAICLRRRQRILAK
jgi:autotransporter-associated beta strand protein